LARRSFRAKTDVP